MATVIRKTKKPVNEYADIATRLRDIRIDQRLTQAQMAQVVRLSPGAVGAIEQGLYTPNFQVLRAINKKFGISYSYIIDGIKDDGDLLRGRLKQLEEENDMLKSVVKTLTKG